MQKLCAVAVLLLCTLSAMAEEDTRVLPTHMTPIQVQTLFYAKPLPMYDKVPGEPSILHIWASWCPPCRHELPGYLRFSQKNPTLTMRAMALNDTMDTAVRFLSLLPCDAREHSVRLSLKEKMDDPDMAPYGIHAFPTTLFVAPDGTIAKRVEGTIDWSSKKTRKGVQAFARGRPFDVDVEKE